MVSVVCLKNVSSFTRRVFNENLCTWNKSRNLQVSNTKKAIETTCHFHVVVVVLVVVKMVAVIALSYFPSSLLYLTFLSFLAFSFLFSSSSFYALFTTISSTNNIIFLLIPPLQGHTPLILFICFSYHPFFLSLLTCMSSLPCSFFIPTTLIFSHFPHYTFPRNCSCPPFLTCLVPPSFLLLGLCISCYNIIFLHFYIITFPCFPVFHPFKDLQPFT